MQVLYIEDQFYRIYYLTRKNKHRPKESQSYSELARTRECYAVKIVSRVLQLLLEVYSAIVKKY